MTTDELIAELDRMVGDLERAALERNVPTVKEANVLRVAVARLKSAEVGMGVMVSMSRASDQLDVLNRWRSGAAEGGKDG
jgi:hypothetical protein